MQRRTSTTSRPKREDLLALLAERGVDYTSFVDWGRLDSLEVEAGEKSGKIREKFTRVGEMMAALRG